MVSSNYQQTEATHTAPVVGRYYQHLYCIRLHKSTMVMTRDVVLLTAAIVPTEQCQLQNQSHSERIRRGATFKSGEEAQHVSLNNDQYYCFIPVFLSIHSPTVINIESSIANFLNLSLMHLLMVLLLCVCDDITQLYRTKGPNRHIVLLVLLLLL